MPKLFLRSSFIISLVRILAITCAGLPGIFAASGQQSISAGQGTKRGNLVQLHTATTVINLQDYGAVGDGVSNDGPALQHALDALASSGGGTLQVPAGHYLLQTPVVRQFAQGTEIAITGEPSNTPITVAGNGLGLDLTSEFIVAVGESNQAITLRGSDTLLITDVGFLGVQEVLTDARVVLSLSEIGQATIRHCEFYGLASLVPGGAIIAVHETDFRLRESAFLGCATNSGVTTSVVQSSSWLGIAVTDCKFVDYGERPDFYSKTPLAPPYSWIGIGDAAPLEPQWSRREAVFGNIFLDEGAYFSISGRPDLFGSSIFPEYDVYMSRLYVNVNNLASDGVYIHGARRVFIERSHFGWSHNAGAAINLHQVGEAVIDLVECVADADTITVEAERLAVINSTYTTLNSTAPYTRQINTNTPEEDPAQYVRQRYLAALNDSPDPAGHFFWTDQIVGCDADQTCANLARNALTAFLSTVPPARFSVSGQVRDENGVPLAAVTVSLTGSQSVAMDTDNNGNFAFTNLATAGNYVLTPAKTHYTFHSEPLLTPTTDRVQDFAGVLARHSISGRVFSDAGAALAGATLTLTGTSGDVTSSDAEGNFSFSNLAAGGHYEVGVARDNYDFEPSSRSFSNLTDDEYVTYVGEVPRYPITAQVARATDGSSLSGVTVFLTGTETASTTTDGQGRCTFSIPRGGNFTLTPTDPYYSFGPDSFAVTNLTSGQVVNFTGRLNSYAIGGQVFANTARVLPGATVTLSGARSETTVVDEHGSFLFTSLAAGGNYVVTVSRPNYSFSLSSYAFSDLTSDKYVAFSGAVLNYTIGGRLAKADGTPLSGAIVTLSGGQQSTATTAADGSYSFTVHAEDDYTVKPLLSNYAFNPQSQLFTNLSGNQSANFTGTFVYVVSGRVTTTAGAYLSGVTISVSGSSTGVFTTGQSGNFELALPAAGNYTITPSKQNYSFSPSAIGLNDLNMDQVRNFAGELNPGVPVIMAGADPERAAALDAILGTTEPFNLEYDYPWSADRRTRIILVANHFDLLPGEGAFSLTATAEDDAHHVYPLTVEFAGKLQGFESLTCIVVRLSDEMADVGDVKVRITHHGFSSEPMRLWIGHPADAPATVVASP